MQARIVKLAPEFESRIVARRVLGPREMESRNANLIGGAINGGTYSFSSSSFCVRCPAWAEPRQPSRVCTSGRHRPIREGAFTAHQA